MINITHHFITTINTGTIELAQIKEVSADASSGVLSFVRNGETWKLVARDQQDACLWAEKLTELASVNANVGKPIPQPAAPVPIHGGVEERPQVRRSNLVTGQPSSDAAAAMQRRFAVTDLRARRPPRPRSLGIDGSSVYIYRHIGPDGSRNRFTDEDQATIKAAKGEQLTFILSAFHPPPPRAIPTPFFLLLSFRLKSNESLGIGFIITV